MADLPVFEVISWGANYHSPDRFSGEVALGVALARWYVSHRKYTALSRKVNLLEREIRHMPEFIKSPKYTKGRLGRTVRALVVHSMAGYMDPTIKMFADPGSREASAHYLISHSGREVQMVEEANAAWHCGVNRLLHPFTFNNEETIGIETEGGLIGTTLVPFQAAGLKVLGGRIATIHRERGWGEPSSNTVKIHREMPFCSTACPTGINILEVIQYAQDAYNGNKPATPVPVIDVTPPASNRFQPFGTDLEPKQAYVAEAKRVQEYLVAKGFMPVPNSNEWGYYGKKTQAAVDKFQKANGITAAPKYYGWWYPQTRAAANKNLS